ncbi:MAG: SDR family oxidoreductase [Ardenticatenaceae bacterium]|nr:SDR family oxidoreductase [Ardenticatenaceae bacterium]
MAEKQQSMEGQVVLVTGGGGGIGSGICRRMAQAGARVVILFRSNAEKAQRVLESLDGEGHWIVQASITDSEQVAAVADQFRERYGQLNLLVNNAGVTIPVAHDDLDGLSDEWIDRIFQTNWRGAFAMVRAFRPLMADPATIVNLSSIAGQTGIGSNVAYCASKAAMDSMTRSLARALAPQIRVLSVSPGWVLGEYAKRFSAEYIEEQRMMAPMQRLSTPEDVAETIWAAHNALPMATGVILPVDGGRPLGIS